MLEGIMDLKEEDEQEYEEALNFFTATNSNQIDQVYAGFYHYYNVRESLFLKYYSLLIKKIKKLFYLFQVVTLKVSKFDEMIAF
jgi:hypothetical protein